MNIEILENNDLMIEVVFKGIHRSYLNAIRRFTISEVPTLAIDEVIVLENTSVMYDELLAHRLGLIPLKTDLSRYKMSNECDCKNPLGCSKCRVQFVLDVDASNITKMIYSSDLISDDEFVKPISGKIPLVKLAPKQTVKLEAYARLGTGKEHAKWQPTSISVLKTISKDDSYILHLESVGSLSAKEILMKAVEILNNKLKEFTNKIEKVIEVESD